MKNFILAARPKTLLASIIPTLASYSFFIAQTTQRSLFLLSCCLISAICIQIATNLFNDLIDHQKGADRNRTGPTRVTAQGLVSQQDILKWTFSVILIGLLFSVPIFLKGGLVFLMLGLLSYYLSFGYTGGPFPLAYIGLGEVFVFIFFGLFATVGSYYIFSGEVTTHSILLGVCNGFLTTTLICVNNLRDKNEDIKVGKRTLATRMTTANYQRLIQMTIFLPYFLLPLFGANQVIYLTLIALVPAQKLRKITLTQTGEKLNEGLKFSVIHLTLFMFLLSLSYIYGHTF